MKVNADHHPSSFTKTHGKLWFNKNIVQSEKTDEMTGDTRTVYDYDQIEVTSDNEEEIMKQAWNDGQYLAGYKSDEEHVFEAYKIKADAKPEE